MVQLADFLERMREGIVTDIVQQSCSSHDGLLFRISSAEPFALRHRGECSAREVIRAERVLEARVSRAGINEISESELPDVAQPLKNLCVDEPKSQLVDADVVPEWVAQNLEFHARRVTLALRARAANSVARVGEFRKVVAEHSCQLFRLSVISLTIWPGAARNQNFRRNSWNRCRD